MNPVPQSQLMSKIRILIVEDELIIAEDIRMQLEDLGYEIISLIARNYDEALKLFREEKPDLVLLDWEEIWLVVGLIE